MANSQDDTSHNIHWPCHWNWCRETFLTKSQLLHHFNLTHIVQLKPVKRKELQTWKDSQISKEFDSFDISTLSIQRPDYQVADTGTQANDVDAPINDDVDHILVGVEYEDLGDMSNQPNLPADPPAAAEPLPLNRSPVVIHRSLEVENKISSPPCLAVEPPSSPLLVESVLPTARRARTTFAALLEEDGDRLPTPSPQPLPPSPSPGALLRASGMIRERESTPPSMVLLASPYPPIPYPLLTIGEPSSPSPKKLSTRIAAARVVVEDSAISIDEGRLTDTMNPPNAPPVWVGRPILPPPPSIEVEEQGFERPTTPGKDPRMPLEGELPPRSVEGDEDEESYQAAVDEELAAYLTPRKSSLSPVTSPRTPLISVEIVNPPVTPNIEPVHQLGTSSIQPDKELESSFLRSSPPTTEGDSQFQSQSQSIGNDVDFEFQTQAPHIDSTLRSNSDVSQQSPVII